MSSRSLLPGLALLLLPTLAIAQTAREPVFEPAPDVLQIATDVRTAPGRLPLLRVKRGDKEVPLPLQHTKVFAEVTGFVAQVDVTQTYRNDFAEPIEAMYVFPLPENAAVDDLTIRIGDRVIRAQIKKRAEAKATYEAAKSEGHTAALLEQERPNIFTQSVANIAPGEAIDITLRYVQHLTYDAGNYEFVFPMVVGPRYIPGQPIGKQAPGWSPDTDQVDDASR
ncbi:MAG: hypothetical protein KC620_17275, partial [Myxococcales bacterium]|nr:hypothetical protein [Myxococcales bacterium]